MKNLKLLFIIFLLSFSGFSQSSSCGVVLNNTFDDGTALSNGWTEYNTDGRITVNNGQLKFDHNTTRPSAYQTFTPTSVNSAFTFDVSATRNTVNCQVHLTSSTGKHLSSVAIGVQTPSIKYATSINSGVPGGFTTGDPVVSFTTNTVYTVSTLIDFANKKVKFYVNGELMAIDIPFLEDAEDVAKIDIQLIYMYANNGQFYFDNISLASGEENRLQLKNDVSNAIIDLNAASVGNSYNQYPQSEVDVLQGVINTSNDVLNDCDSASDLIDNTIVELQAALEHFNTTRVNDPVLKIYPAYNFSGEEHEMYCGYYNGNLANYDDWAVSFTLEKGYMVTFAENVNGTGASKVYVAAENDLQINLPADLQKKASFIRVGPWFNIHKKGMAGKGTDVIKEYNNSWHYNWSTTGSDVGNVKFVPNQWGGGTVTKAIELGNRMDIAHYMSFNEPDNDDQSNMTTDKAIEKYEAMLASGLRLGSPAVTDGSRGQTWRNEFMTKAEAEGLRVDFIVVHYYKKTSPQNFYNWLKVIHDKWNRPIWIKEFNYGATWTAQPASNEAAGEGLISYLNMMDDAEFVERYSVFTWQPDKPIYSLMSVRNPVTLSSSGVMYKNHVSPVAYTQEVYEQGEQLSTKNNSIASKVTIAETVITNGVLNLIYADELKNNAIELTIYTTVGQLVKKVSNNSTKIDVSKLSSGVYIIKIATELGYFTDKIIIQ